MAFLGLFLGRALGLNFGLFGPFLGSALGLNFGHFGLLFGQGSGPQFWHFLAQIAEIFFFFCQKARNLTEFAKISFQGRKRAKFALKLPVKLARILVSKEKLFEKLFEKLIGKTFADMNPI